MKKLFGIVLLLSPVCTGFAQKSNDLKWLTGAWSITTGKGNIVETWRIVNDSTLAGESVFVRPGNDSMLQETLSLEYRKGAWTYVSTVQGQNDDQAVAFPVIFLKGMEFICENPEHDFPQRIAYRRIKHQLFASIEGRKNGMFQKRNFDFMGENP